MSGLLAIFYWVVIPIIIFRIARGLFRRSTTSSQKRTVVAVSVAVFLGLLWIAAGEKWWLDYQVRELCAKDGGIKVYERVMLPPGLVDKSGVIRIPITPYNKLRDTDEYYLDWKITNLKQGNPRLERSNFRLIRRSDQKVLGESVTYSRGGGDLPGPWHPSSFSCPEPSQQPSLESSIFVKGDKK